MQYPNYFELFDRRLAAIEGVLQELRQQRKNLSNSADEIGCIKLAQEVTRLSKARIYALVSARAIPHQKRGNRLHFDRAELIAWVKEGRRAVEGQPT